MHNRMRGTPAQGSARRDRRSFVLPANDPALMDQRGIGESRNTVSTSARDAGRRASCRPPDLSGEGNGPRSRESLRQPSQHREVGVKRDPLKTPNPDRSQPVLMLQASKLALGSRAATVEVAPPLRLAWDERVQAVSLDPPRLGGALPARAAPLARAALGVRTRKRPGAVLAGRGEKSPRLTKGAGEAG